MISDAVTSALVHRMRSLYDAILVGRKTAEMDNPSLTVRYWTGDNPLRVVIDKDLSLPRNLRLFTDGIKTLVFTSGKHVPEGEVEYITIDFQNRWFRQYYSACMKKRFSL